MIIGIDVDGVLAKYNEALAEVVETARDLPKGSLGPPSGWNFPNWGLTDKSFRVYHTLLMNNIVDMHVYEGAKQVLELLAEEGNTIKIVTARGSTRLHDTPVKHRVIQGTVEWLSKHSLPFHEICFVDDKTSVYADVYIEDSPGHLESFIKNKDNYIIFDHLYNRDVPGFRVKSWKEIGKELLCQTKK